MNADIMYLQHFEAQEKLIEIAQDWPAASMERAGAMFVIYGDHAKTKVLHTDGHIY